MDNKLPELLTKKVIYDNAITKEERARVVRKFPFAQGAPDWVMSVLLESNNIDDFEQVLYFYNAGGEMLKLGTEDTVQSHQNKVSFMTIHDIAITEMQQQDIEANQGTITYKIKIHQPKSAQKENEEEEDEAIDDELITLREGMTIRDLKSYILSLTHAPFFLKFHMGNEEKLDDLITRTKEWNDQRGISNVDEALTFDVYLDRERFDLYMEVDLEQEQKVPLNPGAENGKFKYLDVKNLSGRTSIDQLFKRIKRALKETYGVEFKSKTHTIGIQLENGEVIVREKDDAQKKSNTLSDHYITRFSTIKFFATENVETSYHKAGADYINIIFPQYLRKDPLKLPKGNSAFEVAKTLKMIYDKVIIDEKAQGMQELSISDFRLYKMDEARTECRPDVKLVEYQEPKKNMNKQMIYNFMFDMCNVVVLRPFGSDDYIYVPWNRNTLTTLDQLKQHVTWKHLDCLDSSLKNDQLKSETFR